MAAHQVSSEPSRKTITSTAMIPTARRLVEPDSGTPKRSSSQLPAPASATSTSSRIRKPGPPPHDDVPRTASQPTPASQASSTARAPTATPVAAAAGRPASGSSRRTGSGSSARHVDLGLVGDGSTGRRTAGTPARWEARYAGCSGWIGGRLGLAAPAAARARLGDRLRSHVLGRRRLLLAPEREGGHLQRGPVVGAVVGLAGVCHGGSVPNVAGTGPTSRPSSRGRPGSGRPTGPTRAPRAGSRW